jgi:hypothetical protein
MIEVNAKSDDCFTIDFTVILLSQRRQLKWENLADACVYFRILLLPSFPFELSLVLGLVHADGEDACL